MHSPLLISGSSPDTGMSVDIIWALIYSTVLSLFQVWSPSWMVVVVAHISSLLIASMTYICMQLGSIPPSRLEINYNTAWSILSGCVYRILCVIHGPHEPSCGFAAITNPQCLHSHTHTYRLVEERYRR